MMFVRKESLYLHSEKQADRMNFPECKSRKVLKRLLLVCCAWLFFTCLSAQRHYTFESCQLGPEWRYVGQPDLSKYVFADGKLRLKGSVFELREEKPSTFVGLEQTTEKFVAETKLTLFDAESGDEAGLCVFKSREGYIQCCLNNYQESRRLKVRLQLLSHRLLLVDRYVGMLSEVWLRVSSDGSKLKFCYSTDGKEFKRLEEVDLRLLKSDLVGGEDPALVGMYAFMGSTKYQAGYTFGDFDYFDFQENP